MIITKSKGNIHWNVPDWRGPKVSLEPYDSEINKKGPWVALESPQKLWKLGKLRDPGEASTKRSERLGLNPLSKPELGGGA